ncbi:MAG TPA: AAA family ATPase, partial [Chitinophagaceae bacterium]
MLSSISIKNYAIIDELTVTFSPGMNAITGETGAGKSIIVGALGLILGERADSTALVDKQKKCVVEGFFAGTMPAGLSTALQALEIVTDSDLLIIRREILPGGKSRAFVNDTPVNLAQLNTISSLLVDLHQQFDTLQVSQRNFARDVIDALAGRENLCSSYRKIFSEWTHASNAWKTLSEEKTRSEREYDYNTFQ